MGRQIGIHATAADVNSLLCYLQKKESVEVALRDGNTAIPQRLAFLPDIGHTFVFWSNRFASEVQRKYIANAEPPYHRVDEFSQAVLELDLPSFTTWEGQPALAQGRIYGIFEGKSPEFERWYERIVRYIRRYWRKNPVGWMGGYIGPAANEWFEQGGLLLPNYLPPVRSDWVARLSEQHPKSFA